MKKILFLLNWLLALTFPIVSFADNTLNSELLELEWLDLIPQNERNAFNNLAMPPLV